MTGGRRADWAMVEGGVAFIFARWHIPLKRTTTCTVRDALHTFSRLLPTMAGGRCRYRQSANPSIYSQVRIPHGACLIYATFFLLQLKALTMKNCDAPVR